MKYLTQQAGSSLVMTLVIIMIIAILATYILSLQAVQYSDTSVSRYSNQADFAAYSGMQWAEEMIKTGQSNQLKCNTDTVNFALSGGTTADFHIKITCYSFSIQEGTSSYILYKIDVIATKNLIANSQITSQIFSKTFTNLP